MPSIKKIIALIACFALVFSCVGLCYADTFPSIMQIEYGTGTVTYTDDGFILDGAGSAGFAVNFSTYNSSSRGSCSVTFDHGLPTNSSGNVIFQPASNATVTYSNLVGCFQLENENVIRASTGTTYCSFDFEIVNPSSSRLPRFSSGSAGSNSHYVATWAFNYLYIDNDPIISDVVGEEVTFDLQPGYAYVIEGECEVSDRSFTLTGTSNLSALSNKNGSVQWFGSVGNIRDGFSPDLNNSQNLVVWSPLNPNPSGEASNYSYHSTDVVAVSSGAAYVITYPLYYGSKYVPTGASAVVQNAVNMSGSVYIQYSGDRPTMRRVALKSEQSYSDNFISYYNVFQPSVLNETVSYTVSDDVVSVDPSTAPSGGADAGSPSEDVDNTILGILQRFINNISGLISSGSHAISELVTLGSSFMMSIAAMYQWLPSGLTTLIITAFTIVLVIGVIKLLWK